VAYEELESMTRDLTMANKSMIPILDSEVIDKDGFETGYRNKVKGKGNVARATLDIALMA